MVTPLSICKFKLYYLWNFCVEYAPGFVLRIGKFSFFAFYHFSSNICAYSAEILRTKKIYFLTIVCIYILLYTCLILFIIDIILCITELCDTMSHDHHDRVMIPNVSVYRILSTFFPLFVPTII